MNKSTSEVFAPHSYQVGDEVFYVGKIGVLADRVGTILELVGPNHMKINFNGHGECVSYKDILPFEYPCIPKNNLGIGGSVPPKGSIDLAIEWLEKRRNSPKLNEQIGGGHYKDFVIQPKIFHVANGLDGTQEAVIDYVVRHEKKNGKEDLLKAIHHLEMYIELKYPEE